MDAEDMESVDAWLELEEGVCVITHQPLDVTAITNSVGHASAGATAVFIGTTRDSFKGKVVTKLEYQAYTKLAIKTMADIVRKAFASASRSEHHPNAHSDYVSSLVKCAVYHRIGTVPVGDPSIVIAVSSPHRKEAFVACELILEDVKLRAQIWKREYYEGEKDEEAEWKSNHC